MYYRKYFRCKCNIYTQSSLYWWFTKQLEWQYHSGVSKASMHKLLLRSLAASCQVDAGVLQTPVLSCHKPSDQRWSECFHHSYSAQCVSATTGKLKTLQLLSSSRNSNSAIRIICILHQYGMQMHALHLIYPRTLKTKTHQLLTQVE